MSSETESESEDDLEIPEEDDQNNGFYNPTPVCCHEQSWDSDFSTGYNQEWNSYQNSDQHANVSINGNNIVNIRQSSDQQQQGPSYSEVLDVD